MTTIPPNQQTWSKAAVALAAGGRRWWRSHAAWYATLDEKSPLGQQLRDELRPIEDRFGKLAVGRQNGEWWLPIHHANTILAEADTATLPPEVVR